jgi:hypothetical protein
MKMCFNISHKPRFLLKNTWFCKFIIIVIIIIIIITNIVI